MLFAEIIRPVLRGRDIKRYGYDWAGLYLICTFPAAHIQIDDYPAIKDYLASGCWSDELPNGAGKLKLEQTGQQHEIEGVRFRSRKRTSNQWFETQDTIDYMDDFDKQKIIYQELSQGSRFAIDDSGEFAVTNTAYVLVGSNLKYLIRILNNRLTEFIFRHYYSVTMGSSGIRWLNQYIVELPIIAPDQWIEDKTNILTEKEVFQFLIKSYHFSDLEISWILTNVKH